MKMRKIMISGFLVFGLGLFVKLSPSELLFGQAGVPSENSQFVLTTCKSGYSEWLCNNCWAGESTCFDHSCQQCLGN